MMVKKHASAGDMELMQGIMSAIRVARARYGVLEDRSGFVIEVGGSKVPVVNSNRFASPACLSKSLVEGALPEKERPNELELAKPADPVVAMTPRFKGNGYDTVLFHELIHSQQILRMWRRRGIDLSGMSHRDVVEGWRDRDIPMPKSQQVDEEYGSVHAEVHAYMMHVAYSAIRKAAGRMEGGVDPRDAEESAVSEASREASSMMKMLRGARATLADDPRFSAFMRGPAAEHGVDMAAARSKSRWRMGDEEWSRLTEKMGKRIEHLVRSMVRQMALRSEKRKNARLASSGGCGKVAASLFSNNASEREDKMEYGWKKTASGGWEISVWEKTATEKTRRNIRWTGEEFEEIPEWEKREEPETMPVEELQLPLDRREREAELKKRLTRQRMIDALNNLFKQWDTEKQARLDRLRRENPDLFRPVEESAESK
jgi:hypothetical protein